MRSRWFGASLIAVAGLLAAPAPASAATGPGSGPESAPAPGPSTATMALYAFNGRAGSILDGSGRGHPLRVISGHGGAVRTVVHGRGTALAFPPRCTQRVCPHVALQARHSPEL